MSNRRKESAIEVPFEERAIDRLPDNELQSNQSDRPSQPTIQLGRRQWLLHAAAASASACCCFGGCRSTPVTGRRQLILVPESQEVTLGAQAFQETVQTETPSQDARLVAMVKRVGARIAGVAGRDDFQWDFHLIRSDEMNAFCLPGGKVAVYDGLLPVCVDEAGLAVVMSHEIAHALARHGGERMSHTMVVDGAKRVASQLAGKYIPDKQALLMQAYGVGTKYGVLLPYNRKQETEADEIGLSLMSHAGYDPTVAPAFWNRFGELKEASTAEFLSTHPSDQRRSADLLAKMDAAVKIYATAPDKLGRGEPIS